MDLSCETESTKMSYTKCVYSNCDNTSQDISMFRFPVHDQERLIIWIRNSGNIFLDSLTNEELRRRYICAAHFSPSCVHKGNLRSRLLGPAIPIPFHVTTIQETAALDMDTDEVSSPEVLKVKTPTKFYGKRSRTIEKDRTPSSSKSFASLFEGPFMVTTPTTRISRKCLFEGPKRRLSRKCLFEKRNDDTPKTKRLKAEASSLLRKNRCQRSQIIRLRAKSQADKKVNIANFPSEASKTLVLMQQRKLNSKQKWTKAEKDFCLSLYYKSPSTYYFLRRQGIVLAAPSTIRMWLSKSDCAPGLSQDTFNKIRKRFENSTIKEKACIIAFDEMSIMTNLEYSKKFDLIEGFEDLGGCRRCNKTAKYALVFVIRALYDSWKLPVCYFLSNSNVKAENVHLLLKALISKLFDSNLLPKAVVCDQATTNQKVFKDLGVTLDYPFFFSEGRKIFALFDVPHLIKNIRNNLLNSDFIHKNDRVSFADILKVYELDKKSIKSRSLTKLSDRHLNPNPFQKMNVSLATQIFSNSVAAALRTAVGTGELQSKTAMSTANFVEKVNNMFDALNSRNQFDKNPYRHALSNNSIYVKEAIEEGKNLFCKLEKITVKKNKTGQFKSLLTRPPCFDGVIQSCNAISQLFNEEQSDPDITFLITSKLNQDVIENLFARFRQKGGANRNPTSKLLRSIFRSNLVNSLIKLPENSNCEEENDTYVSFETATTSLPEGNQSGRNEMLKDEPTTSKSKLDVIASESGVQELAKKYKSAKNLKSSIITLENCSITYFAGYLAKVCLSKYKCDTCTKNLIKEIDLDDESQLLILNKSYRANKCIKLKMPSDNLIAFIKIAIDCYNLHFVNIVHQTSLKSRLFKAIIDFFKCEAKELLDISCKSHLYYIVERLIVVKINFYCKNFKSTEEARKNVKLHPKLRILKNK